ncbi:MAG: cytochrome P450 [Acidimicrobiaceae bacterium]|nr:cytochrome P450 [Acidimicrobiaceae bacterium]
MSIPGPSGDQIERFLADPEGLLHDLQSYGRFVHINLAGADTVVIYDVEASHRLFADKLDHVGMAAPFELLSHATGSGILTNYDWDTWRPRRRAIVKPLGARAVGQFHDRMIDIIDDELDQWTVGDHPDLTSTVRRLTLRVVADLLFTTDLTPDAVRVIDGAVEEIHLWAEADPAKVELDIEPASFRKAIDDLDTFIRGVMDARPHDNPGNDMVGHLLLAAQDEDMPLDHDAVRDEAITLILAGHETVTNTITFALNLLARHPEARNQPPRHIVDETLRIYPPVHITDRLIVKDLCLGPITIPAGWDAIVPEFIFYRDDRYFERAAEFLPERWADDSPLHLNRRAYFPFLTGPKFCVGSHFALLEAAEAVERFCRRFRMQMLDPDPPECRFFALSYGPANPMPYHLELS